MAFWFFHFNAQKAPKLPIGELHLYPKHEILDVAMDTPSPQVLGFLPEVLVLEGLVVRFSLLQMQELSQKLTHLER